MRVLVRDDVAQARRAARRLREEPVFVAKSVLLETAWVLLSVYEIEPERARAALRALLGLPHLIVEDRVAVLRALAWWEAGMDFADALHLASGEVGGFVTFDQELLRRARSCPSAPRVESA